MLVPISDYRLRQREYLLRIARAMTSRLDLSDLLQLVIDEAGELLSAEAGLIALRRPDGGHLQVYTSFGLDQELLELFSPLLDGEFFERLVQEGGWMTADLSLRLQVASSALGVRLRQLVALPLVVGQEPLGMIYVFRASSSPVFSANDRQVLADFADQAAIAVHNAQLYQRLRSEKRHLNTIIEYSADGVLILDGQWRVQTANEALERMLEWPREEILDRTCAELFDLHDAEGRPICQDACPLQQQGCSDHPYVEGVLRTPSGRQVHVGISYTVLRDAQGRLREAIANVRDITQQKEAEELQSTFISIISHELKTPVAIIKGYAGTLRREDAQWDLQTLRQGLQVIEEESDRLDQLITNLLEASRIQSGGLSLNPAPIQIVGLVEKLVDGFRMQTDKHDFELDFPADFPPLWIDFERIRMVLSNLLANAVKYSPEGGTIRLGGWVELERAVLYVADEGIGLPQSEIPHVFDRFYRVDNRLSRTTAGAGLGLYLSRSIVTAHGGEMWVRSRPGEGSTFYFSLPLREGAA
ncbi:MAG: PAS domain S-box protein [Chloroflexia bacterium]|nr:PAS domain S-box protein [Chloroflexia bacterium]